VEVQLEYASFFMSLQANASALLGALLLLSGGLPVQAAAPLDPSSSLEARYAGAKKELAAKRYAQALEGFRALIASLELEADLAWGSLVGAGLAAEGQGRKREALLYYQQFLLASGSSDLTGRADWLTRRKGLSAYVRELEASVLETHGRVSLESTPAGARVTVDDGEAGPYGDAVTTPTTVYLKPGVHALVLELAGHERVALEVRAVLGDRKDLHLPLTRVSAGVLLVQTGAADALVRVDGSPLGEGREVRIELEAGRHVVDVRRPAREPFVQEVTITAGDTSRLAARWPELVPGDAGRAPEAVTTEARSGLAPMWGWITLGGGAAVALAGIPFTIMAGSARDEMDELRYAAVTDANQKKYDDAEARMARNQVLAGVMYGLGGVAVAGGAVLLLLSDGEDAASAGATTGGLPSVGWVPGPAGGQVTLGWTW
jgi:hypothetical protein